MARPRIFISSTYYDLKHIRSSLEIFVESLGFEPVLSEKGDIAYVPDSALDESCYREAAAADIFVLVVGGRYGSEISSTASPKVKREFFDRYESVTRKEFETAQENNIPVFILIDSGVFAEYQTYLRNRSNDTVKYAHVDSVNIFKFIESILSLEKNNPIFQFERSSQIEAWLRDQWAGLFRELLRARSQQRQLLALTTQVAELKAVSGTLKSYMEVMLSEVSPTKSEQVIEEEEAKLEENKKHEMLRSNGWFNHLRRTAKFDDAEAESIIFDPNSEDEVFSVMLKKIPNGISKSINSAELLKNVKAAQRDFNSARQILGRPEIVFSVHELPELEDSSLRERKIRRKTTD